MMALDLGHTVIWVLFFLTYPLFTCTAQEAVRVSYLFYYKLDSKLTEKPYRLAEDMAVDFDGRKSVFYSEAVYRKDSLNLIAFDRDGNTVNSVAVGELYGLSGKGFSDWICFVDRGEQQVRIRYNRLFAHIDGTARLAWPEWELLDDSVREIAGYPCKKARTRYYGREWIVWYTEEIPMNTGPWLLQGLPGLIVSATDANQYFHFMMRWIEKADRSRYDEYEQILAADKKRKERRRGQFYASYPLEQADRMATHTHLSSQYLDQLMGISATSQPGYIIRANGFRETISLDSPYYVPLIPEKYWDGKK